MKKKISLSVIGVIVLAVIGAVIWLYTGHFNDAKAKVFKKIPFPVAVVRTNFVSGKELLKRYSLAQTLFNGQAGFKPAEVRGQILDQLIDNQKLQLTAAAHNIRASSGDIDTEYKGIVTQYSGGDEAKFKSSLSDAYHLTPEDFKDQVIQPDVLRTNLTLWYNNQESLNKDAFAKKKEVLDKLSQGTAFDAVASQYSDDDATKKFGGDMGFVTLGEILPEFQKALTNAKANDQVQITSRYGLHVAKVTEVDTTSAEPRYHLLQIYLKEDGFNNWYSSETGKIKTHKLVKF